MSSGSIASIGEYLNWGAERAAFEINQAGGIAGKPVKVIGVDTALEPQKGVVEMGKIVEWALVALGPVPEPVIEAAAQDSEEVPEITLDDSIRRKIDIAEAALKATQTLEEGLTDADPRDPGTEQPVAVGPQHNNGERRQGQEREQPDQVEKEFSH
mgnify:CR=1 FL=1